MHLITVRSSNGELSVEATTGEVIHCELYEDGDKAITEIRLFDIQEYKLFYALDEVPASIDILDLGYWYGPPHNGYFALQAMGFKGRRYEEPDTDWRMLIANL